MLSPRLRIVQQDHLPGTESLNKTAYFGSVTYPRFLRSSSSVSSASFLFELRIGRSGLGDDWLYEYVGGGNWTLVGKYLEVRRGVNIICWVQTLTGIIFPWRSHLVDRE